MTWGDDHLAGVPVLELGLRHYDFWKGWGDGPALFWSRLRLAYFSFGAIVASGQSGTLNPFLGKEQWGGFLSWGDLKLAYVGGLDPRWLVSKQVEFIGNVF